MADQQVTQPSDNRSMARRGDALSPFAPIRREMERMFEDFFSVFGVPARAEREGSPLPAGIIAPRIDVSETDDEVRITAKEDQLLVPLPEGASYLGFIFARGDHPAIVERVLREAHARLRFAVDLELPVVQSRHG